jgi:signal transduction histidine kinase
MKPNDPSVTTGGSLTASCESIREAEKRLQIEAGAANFHPLETIVYFRRWPRSLARNLIYTVIFNAMFAALFTAIGLLGVLFSDKSVTGKFLWNTVITNLLISNVIGFSWWIVMEAMEPVLRWINRQGFAVILLFYSVIGTAIVTGSFYLVSFLPGFDGINRWLFTKQQLLSSFFISFIVSLVIGTIWRRRADELAGQIDLARERERAEAAERAAVEASLRALQAQIEPHFLFNTLANVTSLIHSRPDDAKRMLEEFISYLRASLATTREAQTSLQQEFQMMQSFLAVLKVRMGNRLATSVDLPPDLQGFHIPPMLIQPLVENAIKHGLEPKVEGGEVALKAVRDGDSIKIMVEDTGLGFQGAASKGIGLQNVRERLDKLFPGRAHLSIEENQPCGTRMVITLPA